MIYISLKELIDDILLIVRNNNISESEDLSRDQIAVWIKAYKQKLIQDRLDRQKSGVADADLIDEDIDDIFIREKGPYELEDVQPIGNNPIYTRRTKLKFENIYNDDASSILAVHDEEGCDIQLMNHVRRHYNYFRKRNQEEKMIKEKIKENLGSIIGIVLAIAAFVILYFMPLPEGMSKQGQVSLALFTFALIMWISRPIPIYLTSIIIIL